MTVIVRLFSKSKKVLNDPHCQRVNIFSTTFHTFSVKLSHLGLILPILASPQQ